MTTDVRTLLHNAADVPQRAPDIDGARQSARTRRRRRRGFGALAAVVVAALVVGALALGSDGGDGAQVAIGARQAGSEVPEGWKQIQAEPGITIAIPPGWDTYDYGHTDVAERRIAVGSAAPEAEIPFSCPDAAGHTGAGPDGVWVTVWEYPAGSASVSGPAGNGLGVGARPATFARPGAFEGPTGSCEGGAITEVAFEDAGRVFVARAVVREPPKPQPELQAQLDALKNQADALLAQMRDFSVPRDIDGLQKQYDAIQQEYYDTYGEMQQARTQWAPQLKLAAEVLDTLRVEPLVAETTTSLEHTDSIPPTTTTPTTAPPTVPTDDEKLISQAFITWMDDQSDAGLDASVQDPDAVRVPSHEGWDQHTSSDLAQYEGRVESVTMTDTDHAQVVYTILHGGQVAFSKRLGSAVRVDGQWKVSTETVCGMLALGGVTCPA